MGLPWWLSGKESTCHCRRCRFSPWVRKIPCRRKRQPTPLFLPGKSMQRSLADYGPWGRKRVRHSLATKQHHHHHRHRFCFSLNKHRHASIFPRFIIFHSCIFQNPINGLFMLILTIILLLKTEIVPGFPIIETLV